MFQKKEMIMKRKKKNRVDNGLRTLQISKAMQTRFRLIPDHLLNDVVVAGIQDMKYIDARIGKYGKPIDGEVLRFCNPSTKSNYHRIVIDPKGVPSTKNTHIKVPPGSVKAAGIGQKCLKFTGKVLPILAIIASGVRIGQTIKKEMDIDRQIVVLENIVDDLRKSLEDDNCTNQSEIEEKLEFVECLLRDAYDCKKHPGKKTLATILSIGAEWGGAATLSYCARAVALFGRFGPVGLLVAAAITGSKLGSSAVRNFHCNKNGIGTEMQGSLLDIKKKAHVMDLDANVFLGKGVEVGARSTLFQFNGNKRNLTIGKAGANIGITKKGTNVEVEAKAFWTEKENQNVKIGYGLKLDTGIMANDRNFHISVLGFGFNVGEDGVGFKLPFFNYTKKK